MEAVFVGVEFVVLVSEVVTVVVVVDVVAAVEEEESLSTLDSSSLGTDLGSATEEVEFVG